MAFSVHGGEFNEEKRYGDAKRIGEWSAFYRYQAVIANAGIGTDLVEIPKGWAEGDFPYTTRPHEREVPFADGLSIVRILGGWQRGLPAEQDAEFPYGDLVTRDASGALRFSESSLKQRIQPYWDQGYRDITLVLDNFPAALTANPEWKEYGQVRHPDDPEEWRYLIRSLIASLERNYAPEHKFRFRLGTEMQDSRRFIGSHEEYDTFYRIIAEELAAAGSSIGLGPFNRSMPLVEETGQPGKDNVCLIRLAQETAWRDPQARLPFDFIARSMYYFEGRDAAGTFINVLPDERIPGLAHYWERMERVDPRYRGISREIHEFGALNSYERIYGLETGVRGAARMHETIVKLKEEGISRLWHWSLTEEVGSHRLFCSHAWLYRIYDKLVGGQAYTVAIEWIFDTTNDSSAEISGKALWVTKEDVAYLVVSAWHPDRSFEGEVAMELSFPATWWPADPLFAGELILDKDNSIFDRLHRDLLAADNLSESHRQTTGAHVTALQRNNSVHMAADRVAAAHMIQQHWTEYSALMKESLTLSQSPDSPYLRNHNQTVQLALQMRVPSVHVMVWRKVLKGEAR